MKEQQAAKSMAALGHPLRLSLFRLLVRAGRQGLNFGEIQRHLDIPASTLTHHLSTLVQAGLVNQERLGREVISRADFARVRETLEFLTAECCTGVALQDEAG